MDASKGWNRNVFHIFMLGRVNGKRCRGILRKNRFDTIKKESEARHNKQRKKESHGPY